MKTASLAILSCAVEGVCLIWALIGCPVHADSWLPPTPLDARSENGQFTAHVTPAKPNSKATVVVSAIKDRRTNETWRATLSNHASPIEVAVSDEGDAVVTLDNWGGVGYGDDVVAVYGPGGQKAKYSLQEFAPPPKPLLSSPPGFSMATIHGGYEGKFPHSTSSRHWRRYCINFFYRDAGEELFCLWLDWDQKWIVWQMSDGKLRKVAADLAKKMNAEGRRRALQQTRIGSDASAALNFLGRLRQREDRPLIEAWLRDKEFSSSTTTYSSEKSKPSFCFNAYSYRRQEADKILSCWDGLTTNIFVMGRVANYHYLGTVKGRASLNAAPKKGDGTLRLYLIPSAVPLEKWSASQPEHYLVADLGDNFPVVFEDGKNNNFPLGRSIDFAFYGVTAGNYRLKAVWNKVPPLTKVETIVCLPHSGDYESIRSPLISVMGGKVLDGVHIECNTPAGQKDGRMSQ